MSPRRLALLALVLFVSGCAFTAAESRRRPAARATSDRLLIIARAVSVENRPIADQAAALMGYALRDSIDVLEPRQLFREGEVQGAGVTIGRMLERLEQAGWPTAEEGELLQSRYGVAAVLTLEVTTYDQVWGRYGKFTRVGIVARMAQITTGKLMVDLHRELEVDEMRGRAFQFGLESVVGELASSIDHRSGISVVNAWRYFRR